METISNAKAVTRLGPSAVAIPSKQGAVLISHDSSSGTTYLRSEIPLCPAYHFCRESRGLRPSMLNHDQQVTFPYIFTLLQNIMQNINKFLKKKLIFNL